LDDLLTFLEIMLINVLLSGDNAVVIAMASRQLPPLQRKRAIRWGAAVAVILRCLLTFAAVSLLHVPYLQAAGSIMLYVIAVNLLADAGEHEHEADGKHHIRGAAGSLWSAVRTIVAADFVMSLDNVLAIAAVAEGEPVLIVLGILMSIPLIIWGSHLLSSILKKAPQLIYIGSGLLGYAAGKMLVHDPGLDMLLFHGSQTAAQAIPLLSAPLVIIAALLRRRV
jgi:YjbE family integral membrane protein